MKAVKGELGMAMVQDPDTAKYDGMPRSAIQVCPVDFVLPPEKMPAALIRYTSHAGRKVVPSRAAIERRISETLPKVFVLLRSQTGHDFSNYKKNTLCRRIERRMTVQQIENVGNYVRYLQENPKELEILFKELLIGVTNFFRDPEAFEALKKVLLRDLTKRSIKDAFRVWVPGCANGEEAYSIAIIIWECMRELRQDFDVQIFGTDIDTTAIDMARGGIYPANIANDVSEDRLEHFFIKEGNVYKIRKEVREMVVFAPQSIIITPLTQKITWHRCICH